MLRVALGVLALLIGGGAAVLTLLIIVPYYPFWALAVGAGEWSLWLGLLGAVGAVLGVLAARQGGSAGVLGGAAVALGVVAIGVSLIPPLQSLPVARSAGVRLSLGRYLFGFVQPPPASTVDSVTYANLSGRALELDVWRPETAAAGLQPAVVVVHGGSWSSGGRSDFPRWNRWLNQHGYVVFDVDYRIAPQPNWREATGDIKCALGWVAQHAAEYGADAQRIALLGRSAGGHLALLAAYTPQVAEASTSLPDRPGASTSLPDRPGASTSLPDRPGLPSSCEPSPAPVRAVVDFYGPTDLVWGYEASLAGEGVGAQTLERFLGGTPSSAPDAYRIAAPISYAPSGVTPSLLLHGARDQVVGVPHTERLSAALAAGGTPYEAVVVPYAQHGFDYNFDGWGSQIAQPVILRFLEANLTQQDTAP